MLTYLKRHLNNLLYQLLVHSVPRPLFFGNDFSIYPERLKLEGYYSQYGQDKWIAEQLLFGLKQGVFCDIGAHDGITLSNTCYFEKVLGWTGLAFEPLPHVFRRLQANRTCETINGCVGPDRGTAQFMVLSGYTEMLSGLVGHYHPRHLQRIESELKQYGGNIETIEVASYRLNDIFDQRGLTHIDYMNIDVEGAEYSILQSIDFTRFDVTVIGIENNYKDFRIPLFMKRKGYDLNAIVGDEIYVKRSRA